MKHNLTLLLTATSDKNARFYAFLIFLLCVLFMGGGSRNDIQSLIILRPLAVLFIAYALTVANRQSWMGRTFPVFLLLALAALMLMQLIPLPPALWTALPERQIYADIAKLADITNPYRPLTLSPSKTLNSLFSLTVPLAAMLLYLNLDSSDRVKAIIALMLMIGISLLWAVFQIVGPSGSPFYLYKITNDGSAVGLFANRNHQSVILATSIAIIGWYAALHKRGGQAQRTKFAVSIGAMLLVVPMVFITGSRAGLILMIPSIAAAIWFVSAGARVNSNIRDSKKNMLQYKNRYAKLLPVFITTMSIILVSAISIFFSRSEAFERLFAQSSISGLREQIFPVLLDMARDYFPLGSGFGSFEHVFRQYETMELLRPSYLNQAHNDLFQILIEGGVFAGALLAILIGWIAMKAILIYRLPANNQMQKNIALLCCVIFLNISIASLTDYPLRVPSIMCIMSIFILLFGDAAAKGWPSKNQNR